MRLKVSPIYKKRIYQNIIEQIQDALSRGELKPGDKLPSERELAALFSVSRATVREAISVLSSLGLVTIYQGVGIFLQNDSQEGLLERMKRIMQQQDPPNLAELLEIRQGMESQAAYLAAIRRTKEDLEHIQICFEQFESAINKQTDPYVHDFEFHMAVVRASHNQMLMQSVEMLSHQFAYGVKHRWENQKNKAERVPQVLNQHFTIYKSIQEQIPERSQRVMWEHLSN